MALMCCEPTCNREANFIITTVREGGGIAGPDPYCDETHACEAHVGFLLGYQHDAPAPGEIYWHVRYTESSSAAECPKCLADVESLKAPPRPEPER